MSNHTPGPWDVETDPRYGYINPDHVYIRTGEGREGVHVCTMNRTVGHRLRPPSDIIADARLIAAAPDLLAALKGMLDNTHQCGWDCVMSEPCPIGEQAREAIAKAGE